LFRGDCNERPLAQNALFVREGDCRIAGPDDDKMEWLGGDAQMMEYEQSFVDAADTLLLGRKTFNAFSSYWQSLAHGAEPGAHPLPMPVEQQRQYARTIDPMKKIVVSASGKVAAWAQCQCAVND
jgi:dihydrofolate reductase